MSKVIKLIEPFDQLSGKLCQHSKLIINLGRKGVRRDNMWTGKQCYSRDLSERPYSADETKVHTRFKEVRLAVQAIKSNPTKLAQAYEDYAPVRDSYKSFDSYLWKVETVKWNTEYEQNQEQEPLP